MDIRMTRKVAAILKDELSWIGILPVNMAVHDMDGSLTEEEAMAFDAIYFTGGWDSYLPDRAR